MTTPYPLPPEQEDLWIRACALDAAAHSFEPNAFRADQAAIERRTGDVLSRAKEFESYVRGGE